MKFKIALFSLFFSLICAPTNAQEWAQKAVDDSPRHLEWATIKAGDRKVQAFVAYPEVSEKATAIVLIHEIYGHSDWVRLMADHLAEAGYLVVAPDLLSGMAPDGDGTDGFENVTDVRKAVSELPPDQVTSDLKATVAYAKALPASNGKVVVAGFCWGGSQSFRFATNSDQIEAAFVYYGTAPEDKQALKRISVPVYGFYAENDARERYPYRNGRSNEGAWQGLSDGDLHRRRSRVYESGRSTRCQRRQQKGSGTGLAADPGTLEQVIS